MNASGWLVALLLIVLVGLAGFTWYRAEGELPALEAPETLIVGRNGAQLVVRASDWDSGLRSVRAVVTSEGEEHVLIDERFPGNLLSGGVRNEHDAEVSLDATQLAAVKSPAVLRIAVADWSWRGGFDGNLALREVPLTIDVDPPRISVHSGLTYVRQGGSGSVAYRISEETARDGVRVGGVEFRGYPMPGAPPNERIALFGVPIDADPNAPVRVFAEDAAGNASDAGWALVVKPHPQPTGRVRLSHSFMQTVVPRLAPQGASAKPADAFHDINTRLRAENEARIRKLISGSATEPLFSGGLRQLSGSKVTSRFGERRTYLSEDQAISEAVHYGYDLASFSAAPVTAAAAGRVLYADDLGIYGNCVILDHGLGLTTLYGHLSRIDVEAGQSIAKEERLGLTGATGLAGGDHLHFAVLIGETYVDPLEWWDAKWVETHVASNLPPQGR
jgi:murein DD-endopeptidase MepM/ murein hydrolase activator NlpD